MQCRRASGQGENAGQLTTRETGALQRGQARVDRATARAAANGHVGANEQAGIQARENRQSARVFNEKLNPRSVEGGTTLIGVAPRQSGDAS